MRAAHVVSRLVSLSSISLEIIGAAICANRRVTHKLIPAMGTVHRLIWRVMLTGIAHRRGKAARCRMTNLVITIPIRRWVVLIIDTTVRRWISLVITATMGRRASLVITATMGRRASLVITAPIRRRAGLVMPTFIGRFAYLRVICSAVFTKG